MSQFPIFVIDYLNTGSVKFMASLRVGLYLCPYFEIPIVHTLTVKNFSVVKLSKWNYVTVPFDSEIQPTLINEIICLPTME